MEHEPNYHAYWDKTAEIALATLEAGLATVAELRHALTTRQSRRPAIGKLAVTHRSLTVAQVFRVLEQQALTGELFGLIAIEAGFLNAAELGNLLHLQDRLTPSLFEILLELNVITPMQAERLEGQVREQLQSHCKPAFTTASS